MTYADERKQAALRAADTIEKVGKEIYAGNDVNMTKVIASLNTAITNIDTVMRELLVAIKETREARLDASSVVLGTTGMVADSIGMINTVEEDTTDDVKKLNVAKQDLEKLRGQILQVAQESMLRSSKKANSAAGLLRGYASTQ